MSERSETKLSLIDENMLEMSSDMNAVYKFLKFSNDANIYPKTMEELQKVF